MSSNGLAGPNPAAIKLRGLACLAWLAVLATLAGSGCAQPVEYQSRQPDFTLRYPGNWHIDVEGRGYSQEIILSPRAEVRDDDPRIVVYAERLQKRPENYSPGHYSLDLQVGEEWKGRRYILFRYPTTMVVEAYARNKDFAKTNRLAESLARQLAPQISLTQDDPQLATGSAAPDAGGGENQ